jgi:mRNA-degrading endonuclease RelE of RelBE toxin-antitoxin system
MAYRVEFRPAAARDLKKLDRSEDPAARSSEHAEKPDAIARRLDVLEVMHALAAKSAQRGSARFRQALKCRIAAAFFPARS